MELYADEKEWAKCPNSPWKLIFNSKHMDGHGYEAAKLVLAGKQLMINYDD